MNDDNRNMILAIVLSGLVILGWGLIAQTWFPPANEPRTEFKDGKQVPLPRPEADPAADTPQAILERREATVAAPRVPIATPNLRGSINLAGARIDDLVLTRHRQGLANDSPPIRLFSPAGTPHAYFAFFGWDGAEGRTPGADAVWQADGGRLTPSSPVTLSWNNGQGQVFRIRLSVDDGYLIRAEQRVDNLGAGDFAVRPYAVVSRAGASPDPDTWTAHVGPMGVFDGSAAYGHDYDDVAEAGAVPISSTGGWIGFTDQYWLAAAIPDQSTSVRAAFRHNPATNAYQADFVAPAEIIPPGRSASYVSHLFAGAKEVERLEAYSDALGTEIERAIDWGWFRWFMKPIFWLLNWLFSHIGNFGVAIICLVVIVRLLLFPLAQKQFASMAAMRAVQPKMKAIQERYKDDKPKLQEEMMKLYREEKVNPMAGCLPILLQIPIFYALYKVLLLSVEMRHEPFTLWIKDLSAPDPLTPLNLFGFLPFQPPAIIAIGILPILLGVTMWLSMRLNPQPTDPIQKQIFAFMPWVLMVIMAPFAAGLQLYWTVNNVLTIAQQKLLYARHPSLKAQAEAERKQAASPPPPAPAPTPAPRPAGRKRKPKPKPRGR